MESLTVIYASIMICLLIMNPSAVFLGLAGLGLAFSYVCQCISFERKVS